mmetsp:Transcript_7638/g.19644  ORF Transcript_7638/g.19644 Transcript_7638/m.19644 type:complete len:657 (+) Transcript_7638:177-2147(+)
MADLSEFSRTDFNPKGWINAAVAARQPDEALERFLAELEMKLQLTAEDAEAALEANSRRVMQRIPAAAQEVARIQADVAALQSDTQGILEQLDTATRQAQSSVAPLAALDTVKGRMESACNTLKEASELSNMFASIEEVFSGGDLPHLAEVLSTMRARLATVGDVPEFNDGWKQLETLENRLQTMVEGPLAGALAHKKGDMVRQLVGILVAVNRYGVVERHYVTARIGPLQTFWDAFERPPAKGTPFAQWLPRFYDEVLLCVEGEARWCQAVLPDLHPRLLLAMLGALFEKIRKPFARRLAAAAEPQGAVQPTSLAIVMASQAACLQFARNLMSTLQGLTDAQASGLVSGFLETFQSYLGRYGELEVALLAQEVAALRLEPAVDSDLDAIVTHMSSAAPQLIVMVEQALERCMKFTGGSEITTLLKAVDEAMARACGQLIKVLGVVRARCLPDSSRSSGAAAAAKEAGSDGEGEWEAGEGESSPSKVVAPGEEVGAVIQLLSMAGSLVMQLGVLEAQLHTAVTQAVSSLEVHLGSVAASGQVPVLKAADVAANPMSVLIATRLSRQQGLVATLKRLLEQIHDQRYNALPTSTQRAASVQQAVDSLVYDALIHRVAEQLAGVSKLPTWAEESGDNAFNLPSFSAYPLRRRHVLACHV